MQDLTSIFSFQTVTAFINDDLYDEKTYFQPSKSHFTYNKVDSAW